MKIIITESQYRFLVENSQEIDNILDKMNEFGYENLENDEKMMLKDYSEWLNQGKKGDFTPKKHQKVGDFDEKMGKKWKKQLMDGSDFTFTFDYFDVLDNEYLFYGLVNWDGEDWYGLIATDNKGNLTEIDFISEQTTFSTYNLDDNDKNINQQKEKRLQESLGKLIHQVKFFFEEEVIPELM